MGTLEQAAGTLLEHLISIISRTVGMPRSDLGPEMRLERCGIDSLQWADIAYEVSVYLGRNVTSEQLASSPTLRDMAHVLLQA